jgi:probable phosphoglycerate mutase
MTRFCLVRHGETDWNAQRRIQGNLDIPLNPTGIAQAHAAARGLGSAGIELIYSSDLARARQTAEAIAQHAGLPLRLCPELRERCYGIFEGLTYDEAQRRFPEVYARFESRDTAFPVPEGESLQQLASRVEFALRRIAADHPTRTVLVVTHGGVLDIAYRLATGRALDAPRDFVIPNAAYNWIDWEPDDAQGRFVLRAWGELLHLDEALDELPG